MGEESILEKPLTYGCCGGVYFSIGNISKFIVNKCHFEGKVEISTNFEAQFWTPSQFTPLALANFAIPLVYH